METVVGTYPVVVDYGKSVEEMVEFGRYDWSHRGITSKHFPTKWIGKTEIAVELVRINGCCANENSALELFNSNGYRQTNLHELLAFGEKYPDIQRKISIIALISVRRFLRNRLGALCLDTRGSKRILDLRSLGSNWITIASFAVVRK